MIHSLHRFNHSMKSASFLILIHKMVQWKGWRTRKYAKHRERMELFFVNQFTRENSRARPHDEWVNYIMMIYMLHGPIIKNTDVGFLFGISWRYIRFLTHTHKVQNNRIPHCFHILSWLDSNIHSFTHSLLLPKGGGRMQKHKITIQDDIELEWEKCEKYTKNILACKFQCVWEHNHKVQNREKSLILTSSRLTSV